MGLAHASMGAVIVAVWTMSGSATLQTPAPQQRPGAESRPVFRGGVDMVTVTVAVTDKNDRLVTDLAKEDFLVSEDGKPQQIIRFRSAKETIGEPFGLGLVLDASESMSGEKLQTLRIAVERLLRECLKKEDEVYLVQFQSTARLMQTWTTDRNAIVRALDRISPQGRTAIYDGIMEALPLSSSGQYKKQVILVVSDGGDNFSKTPIAKVAEAARASGALVDAIVVSNEFRDNSPLSLVTDATGGRTQSVRSSLLFEDPIVRLGCKEFTQQYELSYARSLADGQYHQIVVGVRRPNLTVRNRRGYVAD